MKQANNVSASTKFCEVARYFPVLTVLYELLRDNCSLSVN